MTQTIQVNMLGKFTIASQGHAPEKELSFTCRSRRIWTLLAYFIIHRDRGIPPQELIDLLWPDGEADLITLQNNVSRARTALGTLGLRNSQQLITCRDGLYRWSSQVETQVDADGFQELYTKATTCQNSEQAVAYALEAIELYKGDFLPEAAMEPWCVHLNAYFRSIYLKLCRSAVDWLLELGRKEEAARICTQVVHLDPMVEEFSVLLIKIDTLLGESRKALDHYTYIKDLYKQTFNVSVSPEMEAARAAAIRALYGKELGLEDVRSFLSQGGPITGAFLCDNIVFRGIVSLCLRETRRSGQPAQIAILSLDPQEQLPEEQSVDMKRLELAITATLRAGDPFTKISANQFMALLPGANAEGAAAAMARTASRLRRFYPKIAAAFSYHLYDIKDLDPDSSR